MALSVCSRSVVAPGAKAAASSSADGIDFIEEDDARRSVFRLLEEVTDARSAHADKHLDKVAAGDREERDIRFARNGFGEQGFTTARRPNQQHPARDAAAQALELFGVAEEFDNLRDFFFGFIDARDIAEV